MARKTLYNGAYVRVNVDRPFRRILDSKDWYAAAKDLQKDIERHCDGIESCDVEFDMEEVCEFCGYSWTEGDCSHNGGCCEEDAKVLERIDAGEIT